MSETPDDSLPIAEDDLGDERLPLIDLESSSASQPSPRKRAAQIGLALLALIVASAVLWNSIGPGRLPTPQPSAPLITVSALLVSNVTNASVTLNGKKLSGQLPMIVSAYLETDVITITAPLFRSHTCQFKGLLTKTDTNHCLFTISSASSGPPYVIGTFFTPDDLVPAQQNQVMTPITQELAQTQQSTAQPGDYIPTSFTNTAGFIASQRATAQLQASATLVQGPALAAFPSSRLFSIAPACAQLVCPLSFGQGNPKPAGQALDMLLNVMLRWQFTNSTGHIVGEVSYPANALYSLMPFYPQVQYVYSTSGWQVSADFERIDLQTMLCINGGAILNQRLDALQFFASNSSETSSDQSTAGCLFSVKSDTKGSGTFLWRFGVLLAADTGAHNLLPDLPMAPPAEIAASA